MKALLLVAGVAFLVHAWSLTFGWSGIDDRRLIVDRASFLSDWNNASEVFRQGCFPLPQESPHYYRPLLTLSFMVDARAPLSPAPFHLTNVLLHVLASALFFSLLLRLGFTRAVSTLVACVFAVHPVVTVAVAWVPGRNDSLLACFIFAAWLCFSYWRERRGSALLGAHLLFFLAALLTKETAVVAPALWAGAAWLEKGKRRAPHREPWLLAGWAGAFAIWLTLRGAVPEQPIALAQGLANAWGHLPALLVHLGKVFVPVQLSVAANQLDSSVVPGLVATAVVAAAIATTRARWMALFGAAMFFTLLAPSLLAPNQLLMENRIYLPLAGALILVASWIESHELEGRNFVALSLIVVAALATRTILYTANYRDSVSFGKACIVTAPSLAISQMTAGNAWMAAGDVGNAEVAYRKAIELEPPAPIARSNLGVLALRRYDLVAAERELREALRADPFYAKAHFNLGIVMRAQGHIAEASKALERAVELDPDNVDAMGELFATYLQQGDSTHSEKWRSELQRHGVRFLDSAGAGASP